MKRRTSNILSIGALLVVVVAMAACSVTKNLPGGQQLYAGMKKMEIENADRTAFGQTALSLAEKPLKVAPNGSIFGNPYRRFPFPLPGMLFYNAFVNDSTGFGRWMFKRFATKPIFISDVNPSTRANVARNILKENGYFNASVESEVIPSEKDSLEAKVLYKVDMGNPYTYDSIQYLPTIVLNDSTKLEHKEISFLKKGDNFSLENLNLDRAAITTYLREKGFYFFRPNDIAFEADTLLTPGKVHLRTLLPANLPKQSRRPWRIGRIVVEMCTRQDMLQQRELKDSILLDSNLLVRYNGSLPIRRNVLKHRIMMHSGDLYNQNDESETLTALSTLGTFASTQFTFEPRKYDTTEVDTVKRQMTVMDEEEVNKFFLPFSKAGVLDLNMRMLKDKLWDVSLEGLYKVKTNNFNGPGINVGLARHNVFKGGEVLSLNLSGNYEWETGKSPFNKKALVINSYQFGADLSLRFPSLLIPRFTDSFMNGTASTTLTASASVLNRSRFFRMNSIGFSMMYDFNHTPVHKHNIVPLRINYNMLQSRSAEFDQLMADNPALKLGFQSQLIAQMGYNYTYDNILDSRRKRHVWFRVGVSQAGNLLSLGYLAAGKKFNETKTLMGVPFAQFVKGTAEVRYTFAIDRNQSIATRLGTGAIYSYGNMIVPPYSEQFYVGGANSIRAFTVRSIGPGSFEPDPNNRYGFIDQTGSFKLEANIEYRGRLMGDLHGAVFLDSGNVWLFRKDPRRPGGALSEIKSVGDFFNQLALGTGAGLRYDLTFLVIRFDVGVGIHLPYTTTRKGYYNIQKIKDGLGLHLAVGYPF